MSSNAQQIMTPEKLWQLGRVTPIGISKDGKSLIYKVGTPNVQENKINGTERWCLEMPLLINL